MSSNVVLVVLIFALLAATLEAVRLIHRGRKSLRWPTAKGKVIALEVVGVPRGGQGSSTYRPTISYRYQVAGRDYLGDRISVTFALLMMRSHESATLHGASSVLDGYYPGAPVEVYYDPDDPGYALLRPGASSGLYLVGFTTTAALAMLVGMWVFFVPRE